MKPFKLLINGELVDGAAALDVINPATEDVLAVCPRADMAQLDKAVAGAKAAFPAWAALPLKDRGALIMKLSQAMRNGADELGRLLTEEQGKPLAQAVGECKGAARLLRYFAEQEMSDKVLKDDETTRIVQRREPLGVIAAITPWNFPLMALMMKVGPALLTGNTLVCKPSPTAPLTTLRFGEMCQEILPAGVVNVIVDQNDLGAALTSHPDVHKVTFTGSTATGKKVMESVSSTLKRLTLELGGNDAAIVLADVDVKEVAPKLFAGAMMNAGQVCVAAKRIYVHESLYDAMCDELAALAKATIVDDGLKQGTQMGPVHNAQQYEKALGYIADAKKNGKVIAGGEAIDRKGYFIPPTIVRDIPDDAALVREEQFSPVLPVLKYADIDDALARANDSPYGLGGTVWAKDLDRALDVAGKIQSGMIWINKAIDLPPDIPLGGAKQSGFGAEMGPEGIEEFTQLRVINMAK